VLLPLLLDLLGQVLDLGPDLADLVIRQVNSPQNIRERLSDLGLKSHLLRDAFALFDGFDFPYVSIALLLCLESRSFLGVALDAFGGLLVVVVHMLLHRVRLR
jgi:hypothetical protein